MNNIIKVAQNKDEILKFENEVFCPQCDNKQFSPFDKLFTKSYSKCVDCTDEKDLEHLSNNIFKIL